MNKIAQINLTPEEQAAAKNVVAHCAIAFIGQSSIICEDAIVGLISGLVTSIPRFIGDENTPAQQQQRIEDICARAIERARWLESIEETKH